MSDLVWDPTANGGAGGYVQPTGPTSALGAPTSATASVMPGLSYDQWAAEQALAAGQLGVNQQNAATGAQSAYNSLLNSIITAYPAYHGPQNWATYANLVTGQDQPGTLGFYNALAGRAAPFQYGDINGQTPLDPFSFDANVNGPFPDQTGAGDSASADGSSGSSQIDWKNERQAAGISADASNPEIDRMFKSGQPVADPAALQSLTTNTPMQASAFYGNRSPEGVPNVGAPILDPTTLTYRAATPADVSANEAAASNDSRNQNEDSRSKEARDYGNQPAPDTETHGYASEQPGTTYQNDQDTGGATRRYAAGGLSVVQHPTRTTLAGHPALLGEHGRDELVAQTPGAAAVFPLEDPRVAVSALAAKIAEQLIRGHQGYQAHPGAAPGALNPSAGVRPIHLDAGGQLYGSDSGGYGGAVSPGATVSTPNQAYDDGSYISDSGQTKVPTGAGGDFSEVPSYQTLPVLDPLQQSPSQMKLILGNPDLQGMLANTIENQGGSWASWYSAYLSSLPYQNRAPMRASMSRGAF